MANDAAWRLFVALDLPEPIRAELGRLTRKWQSGLPSGVRWTAPDRMHLTLKFLGNCSPEQAAAVESSLGPRVLPWLPVALRLGRPGLFPHERAPRVLWIGLEGELDRISRLQKAVEEALIPLGFPAESRPFRPHLTLGRVRDGLGSADRRALGQAAGRLGAPTPTSFQGERVTLYRSELARTGPTYSEVATWQASFLADP